MMIAICDYGAYESYGVYFIKIHPEDMDLFVQYCKDSQKTYSLEEERLSLHGFSELNYKIFVDDLTKYDMEIGLGISYLTIHEHQNIIRNTIKRISEHKNHYLASRTKELENLLAYSFRSV